MDTTDDNRHLVNFTVDGKSQVANERDITDFANISKVDGEEF